MSRLNYLSHDMSESDITPCIKIDKTQVAYILSNVMTVIMISHI